jgi:hypothetical protein
MLELPQALQRRLLRLRLASVPQLVSSTLAHSRAPSRLNTTHRLNPRSYTRCEQDLFPAVDHPSRRTSRKQHVRWAE